MLGILGAATVTYLAYATEKSSKLDKKALGKYAKAFEQNENARQLVQKKAELADKRLLNVSRKKKAIIENSFPQFAEVYGQIQKVDFAAGGSLALMERGKNFEQLSAIQTLRVSTKKEFTDKELICGLLFTGFGTMMVKDSERFLSAAQNQLHEANVISSQAESICVLYDSIIARADRIAELLKHMNALFVRSIAETAKTIARNGLQVRNYSEFDKGVLMTCVNFAMAISDIIDVPVITEDGLIPQEAAAMIETGEKYIREMENVIAYD